MWKNGTVWLCGLATATLATGCFIGDADNAAFIASWGLKYVGGGSVTCTNADTPTVELTMTNRRSGTRYVDSWPCDAYAGQSRTLPGGTYDVDLALKDSTDTVVSHVEDTFDLYHRGLTDLPPVDFGIQSFLVRAWSINKGRSSVKCEEVGAKTVRLVTRLGGEEPVNYDFPCARYSGFTTVILVGPYSVQPQLLDAAERILDQKAAMTVDVRGDKRAELPPITFMVP